MCKWPSRRMHVGSHSALKPQPSYKMLVGAGRNCNYGIYAGESVRGGPSQLRLPSPSGSNFLGEANGRSVGRFSLASPWRYKDSRIRCSM